MKQHRWSIALLAGCLAMAVVGCESEEGEGNGGAGGSAAGRAAGGGPSGGATGGGVGGSAGGATGGASEIPVPETYTFESRFEPGASSVAYSGQTFRQVLISDMKAYIGGLTAQIDAGDLVPADGDIVAGLEFYYRFDSDTAGSLEHGVATDPPAKQRTYDDLGGADLAGKIAGNDPEGQHQDWSTAFVGWDDPAVTTPESLLLLWFEQLDELAVARANGQIPMGPDGTALTKVHVSPEGLDYQQLIQKFLSVAVALSQGADDYLDDDYDGKGLLTPNVRADGKPYTKLEHHWDEGFGYFGAARDYLAYTDDEIAGKGGRDGWSAGYHDSDGDGAIDLKSEYNFGHSTNAAKRDRGSVSEAKTDFTAGAMEAFLEGRTIIANAGETLTDEEMAALRDARDRALWNWEAAVAATVVHYINEVLADMEKFDTPEYDFYAHAKHWSEMKGFALGFQFNPHSPVSDADFARLHQLLGQAPVLPGQNGADAYRMALLEARALLQAAYDFDERNVEAW